MAAQDAVVEFPDYIPGGGSGESGGTGEDDPTTVNFVVEDGSGKTDANTYVSLAEANTYVNDWAGLPTTWDTSTDVQKQSALIQATKFVDNILRGRWKGVASHETQQLAWPRSNAVNEEGFTIDFDVIPTELKNCVSEGAMRLRAGTTLAPDDTTGGGVQRERVKAGKIEVDNTYFSAKSVPKFYEMMRWVSGLIVSGNFLKRA